ATGEADPRPALSPTAGTRPGRGTLRASAVRPSALASAQFPPAWSVIQGPGCAPVRCTRTSVPLRKDAVMARIGLPLLACAATFYLAASPSISVADPKPAVGTSVDATLAVQTAMNQGRHYLLKGDSAKAVEVLEAQLSRINGNRDYLALLRDAYRSHVKNLYLARQDVLAKKYLERLSILDPAAAEDKALRSGA